MEFTCGPKVYFEVLDSTLIVSQISPKFCFKTLCPNIFSQFFLQHLSFWNNIICSQNNSNQYLLMSIYIHLSGGPMSKNSAMVPCFTAWGLSRVQQPSYIDSKDRPGSSSLQQSFVIIPTTSEEPGGGSKYEPLKYSSRREQGLCSKFNITCLRSNRQGDKPTRNELTLVMVRKSST